MADLFNCQPPPIRTAQELRRQLEAAEARLARPRERSHSAAMTQRVDERTAGMIASALTEQGRRWELLFERLAGVEERLGDAEGWLQQLAGEARDLAACVTRLIYGPGSTEPGDTHEPATARRAAARDAKRLH